MSAALVRRDLEIIQGIEGQTEHAWTFRFMRKLESGGAEPVDLTLWKARAQMRSSFGGSVWREFTETDGISLSETGDVSLALDAQETEQPAWVGRTVGVWDLVITSPDGLEVVRFVEGRVRVTRP